MGTVCIDATQQGSAARLFQYSSGMALRWGGASLTGGPRREYAFLFIAMLLMTLSPRAEAQVSVPGVIEAGQIRKQFELPPRPRTSDVAPAPEPRSQTPPPGAEKVRFLLKGVRIEGATVYSDPQLVQLYEELLGTEVSLDQIYAVANRLTAKYRNDGYILSQAFIPAQRVVDGVVRIDVIEGYIAETAVGGEVAGSRALPESYAGKIRRSKPLAASRLERYMLLMNDLPGTFARATVLPSETQFGAADLDIAVEHKPLDFLASFSNRGSRFLGPELLDLRLDLNSALGFYESMTFRYVQTLDHDELRYYAGAYEHPLGTEGKTLGASLDVVDAEPGIGVALANLATNSTNINLVYKDPLIRSRAENLYLRGVFSYYDGENEFSELPGFEGALPDTVENVRALRLGATYDLLDSWRGVNVVDFQVSQGLNIFGATQEGAPDATSPGATPDFTKLNLYAARLQSLFAHWSLLLAVSGQYAFNLVPSSEEFSVGGELFGRAYDAGEIVGSSGFAGKLELRYSGTTSSPFLRRYTLYGLYEGGEVWRNRDPLLDQSLASAGLGVRVDFAKGFAGYLEVDKPLTKVVLQEQNKDTRLFAGISWNY